LIEENGCSLVEINNEAYKPLKLPLWGQLSKPSSALHLFLRDITINKKKRLEHESLSGPETSIFKCDGYKSRVAKTKKQVATSIAHNLISVLFLLVT